MLSLLSNHSFAAGPEMIDRRRFLQRVIAATAAPAAGYAIHPNRFFGRELQSDPGQIFDLPEG